MRGILFGVCLVAACERESAEPPAAKLAEPAAAPIVIPDDGRPRRSISPHCALSGQRPSMLPGAKPVPFDKGKALIRDHQPVIGLVVQKQPLVIDEGDSFWVIEQPAVALDGVRAGDLVRYHIQQVTVPTGGGLGVANVLVSIEPARGEPARPGTLVRDWLYVNDLLTILHDGTVRSNNVEVLKLGDDELAQLMRVFGEARVDTVPDRPLSDARRVEFACARYQVFYGDASPAINAALDKIRERIRARTSYRLTGRVENIRWIDWPAKIPLEPVDVELPPSLASRIPVHWNHYKESAGNTLVRKDGQVYLVTRTRETFTNMKLMTILPCTPVTRLCRIVDDLDIAAKGGVEIDRARVAAFDDHGRVRDDLERHEIAGLMVRGNQVLQDVVIVRSTR